MLEQIWQFLTDKVTGGFATVTAPFQWLIDWWPMFGHFTIFIAFIIVCSFIARFLPDKIKMWLLGAVVIAFAFLAGESSQFKKHLAQDRARREAEKRARAAARPAPQRDGSPFDWFR